MTRVSDGDPLDIVPAGESRAIRVRVFGVDTPERGEPFSRVARNHTRVLAFGKPVRVTGESVDTCGRLVARLRIGDVDLGADLLREGLACHYARYSNDRAYAEAQAAAQTRGDGFWAPQRHKAPVRVAAAGAGRAGSSGRAARVVTRRVVTPIRPRSRSAGRGRG